MTSPKPVKKARFSKRVALLGAAVFIVGLPLGLPPAALVIVGIVTLVFTFLWLRGRNTVTVHLVSAESRPPKPLPTAPQSRPANHTRPGSITHNNTPYQTADGGLTYVNPSNPEDILLWAFIWEELLSDDEMALYAEPTDEEYAVYDAAEAGEVDTAESLAVPDLEDDELSEDDQPEADTDLDVASDRHSGQGRFAGFTRLPSGDGDGASD